MRLDRAKHDLHRGHSAEPHDSLNSPRIPLPWSESSDAGIPANIYRIKWSVLVSAHYAIHLAVLGWLTPARSCE
jgi:hypothetical protein